MTDFEKEQLYINFHKKVECYISSKVSNYSDVEDLKSKVFLKVYTKIDTFDSSKSSISTWIYSITRNTVIDFFRTSKHFYEIPFDVASPDNVEDEILKEETLELLADALEKLDERSKDVIILHYYSNYTLKNIAVMMNMSYSGIKLVHKKAVEQLRGFLDDL